MKNGLAFFKIHSRMATALGERKLVGPYAILTSKLHLCGPKNELLHPGILAREVVQKVIKKGLDTDIFNDEKLKTSHHDQEQSKDIPSHHSFLTLYWTY